MNRATFLSCLCALSLWCTGPAQAQQSAAWTDPDSLFQVAVDPSVWRREDAGQDLLAVRTTSGTMLASCTVRYAAQPGAPGVSRQRMNEATVQLRNGPAIRDMESHPNYRAERSAIVDIDGVAVFDMVGMFSNLQTITRRFVMNHGAELRIYTMQCSTARSDSEGVATMTTLANSIRFLEGTQ